MNQITPAQLHRHGPKRACAARCRPLVCYQAGRTGPCRTAPSPQAPHTTPHPPRPPVGPFSASTRPDSAASVRSVPPPCRHVPALPGWFAPPHGGERRQAAAHRPYGSPGCAPCRPARRLRQEGGHGHQNRCPGCLGACGARPRSTYIPVVWTATHVQMRASAASTPQRGSTRPPGWAGSLRGSSRSPLEAPCDFFYVGLPPGCNPGLKQLGDTVIQLAPMGGHMGPPRSQGRQTSGLGQRMSPHSTKHHQCGAGWGPAG